MAGGSSLDAVELAVQVLEDCLAAATSTGGLKSKKWGCIGDLPIIGGETYANLLCAVGCPGSGDNFLRLGAGKTVADLIDYRRWLLARATEEVIFKKLTALGGDGGWIALDHKGTVVLPFHTEDMYRGYVTAKGKADAEIYGTPSFFEVQCQVYARW